MRSNLSRPATPIVDFPIYSQFCMICACALLIVGVSGVAVAEPSGDDQYLLTVVVAEREIGRLMTDYTWLLDARDYDGYGRLFAKGEILDPAGKVVASGSDAVAGLARRYLGHQPDVTVRHVISSPRIDVDLTNGTATASSFLLTVQAPTGQPAYIYRVASYHDRFRKVDGHWRFESRQELTNWVLKERQAP